MKVVYDYDQPIKNLSEILKIYEKIFGWENCGIEKYENKNIYFYKNNNFSKNVYFTSIRLRRIASPRSIPAASESSPSDIHGKSAKQTLQREKRSKSSIA